MGWLMIKNSDISTTEHNFSMKQKILNLRWHISRSYRFVAEVNIEG